MSQHTHGPATPQITRDPRLKERWRAAAAAYRLAYGEPSNLNRGQGTILVVSASLLGVRFIAGL